MRRGSIRGYLVLLGLAVVAPMAGLAAYSFQQNASQLEGEARASAKRLAQIAAAAIEQFVADSQVIVETIAARQSRRGLDPARCDPMIAEFPSLYAQFRAVAVLDRSGTPICAAGEPAPAFASRAWIERVLETGTFQAGGLSVQPATGHTVNTLGAPMRDAQGRLIGVVAVSVDFARYRALLGEVGVGAGGTMAIVDESGRFLARSVAEEWVGRSGTGVEIVDLALRQQEGEVTAEGVDGRRRLYGFTTVPRVNWKVYSGVLVEEAFAPLRQAALRAVAMSLLSFATAFVLGAWISRRIDRPIQALSRAAGAVAAGRLGARAAVTGPSEIVHVAESFNAMLDAREAAERRRARLEAELRRRQVLSAMGELVVGVAHEVRNPLFGISATLDAFEARFGGGDEQRSYVAVLRREVDRLSRLMTDLLEYGRARSLDPAPLQLADVAAASVAACQPLAASQGTPIETRLEPGLRDVLGDRERLIQALANLVDNALRHAPAGSTVQVTARQVDQNPGWQECVVQDQGPGFAPDDLPRLFEPFFSRRPKGIGLGLAIVRRIVEDHGGTVVASNQDGGGAMVSVRLPERPADDTRPAGPVGRGADAA